MLNTVQPNLGQLLCRIVNVTYWNALMPGEGTAAMDNLMATAASGDFILAVEGAVAVGGRGRFAIPFRIDGYNVTSWELIRWLAPTPEMVLLEQCLLGAEFLQNHIRHFYLLALPNYLPASALLQINRGLSPIMPETSKDGVNLTQAQQSTLVEHYFQAMEAGRKCHEMSAIFGGKIPHQHGMTAAGAAVTPTASQQVQFRSLLHQVQDFIHEAFLPDLYFLADKYPNYEGIGAGPNRFLCFGLFDPRYGGNQIHINLKV